MNSLGHADTSGQIEATIGSVEGVEELTEARARWHGHQLRVAADISVDPSISVAEGHDIAHEVEHALHHDFTTPVHAVIRIEPHRQSEAHEATAHHRQTPTP